MGTQVVPMLRQGRGLELPEDGVAMASLGVLQHALSPPWLLKCRIP